MIRIYFQGSISDLIKIRNQELARSFPKDLTYRVLKLISVWAKIMKSYHNLNKRMRKIAGINIKIFM
jgi:hypothetical protein